MEDMSQYAGDLLGDDLLDEIGEAGNWDDYYWRPPPRNY